MLSRLLAPARKRIRLALLKSLLPRRCDPRSALALLGSPRSGTTWLGQILSEIPGSVVLFEPLHLEHVPEARRAGFSWRTYLPPEADWPEGEAFLRRVFAGRVLNDWTTKEMSSAQARAARMLIVKFVRANRLLPWLCARFALRPPVLIVRHPCAVVASQLREGSWEDPPKPTAAAFLDGRPELVRLIEGLDAREEQLAAQWALDNFVPLSAPGPWPWQLVSYEQLVLDFDRQIRRLFDTWGIEVPTTIARQFDRSSSVTHRSGRSGLSGWQKQLAPEQIDRILAITSAFGLDAYSAQLEPDYDRLYHRAAGPPTKASYRST